MGTLEDQNNITKFFVNVIKDPERKSILKIIWEVSYFSIRTGHFAKQYFSRFLYRKSNKTNFFNYYRDRDLISLWYIYNEKRFMDVLENKYLLYLFFKEHMVPMPKQLAYNDSKYFFTTDSNNCTLLSNASDLSEKIKDLLLNTDTESVIIKRSYDSFGGKNIFKINKSDFPLDKKFLDEIFSACIKSSYIFQECVIQHATMNKLHSHSVNTLRINTFIDKKGVSKVFSVCMRIGTGKSYVDNVSSGGVYVAVDSETGQINSDAYTSLTHGGKKFDTHPGTGMRFKDFQIPFFNEALQIALMASRTLPSLRMVGWDIAITEDGPLLIEGNPRASLATFEAAFGGYRNKDSFTAVLTEANLL